MPRHKGTRNADFAEKRAHLAEALSGALIDEHGEPASLGAMAEAAGVTVPTLKHYFTDHDGAVTAALEAAKREGEKHLADLRDPGRKKLPRSMRAVADSLLGGWRHGLGALFAAALAHGFAHERRGHAAVDHVLEPTLQGLERRLREHQARGELAPDADLRLLALTFLSPLIFALLHQDQLSGAKCRPLDLQAFADAHVKAWLRTWSTGE